MEVSGEIHVLGALSSGEQPPVPIAQGTVWASRVGPDAMEKRKILPLPEIKPQSSST
jgi:hypothetical protein